MGGKTTSTTATKLDGISIQSSVLGVPLAIGWGRARATPNLIWYGAFTAIPHTTKTKAGKGLGGGSKNTTYTYTASLILGACDGSIIWIRTVYRDKSVFSDAGAAAYHPGVITALSQAGFSAWEPGNDDQPVWGYLTSKFPAQALAYSGIAYVAAADYDLGDSASLPNHSFEIDFAIQMAGLADADPKDIVTDFLTNGRHGVPGWGSGLIGDLTDYSTYCRAQNLLLSPVIDSQRQASDFLTEVFAATNSDPVWSEGLLKVKPRGDTAAAGNGVTWTPNLAPIYDLDEDDFSPNDGDPPVTLNILDQSDAYNIVQVEFLDRSNQYNTAVQSAQDLDNIVTYGRRKQDPTSWHSICDAGIATHAAQLLLQRTLYIRQQFMFRLPWDFVLLEPGDYLTLSTATDGLALDRELVRILQIDEDEDGLLTFTTEEVPVGSASAALYPAHVGDGYQPNEEVAPGSVSPPILINAPTSLTGTDPQVWCAAASTSPTWGGCQVWISADGSSYTMVETVNGPARYGVLSAALPAHADPDTTDTLSLDLSTSLGVLLGGTDAEMNAAATLALVGSELISYRDANLTAAYHYGLSPLRRGLYGTSPASHASGERFVRLDDAIAKVSYSGLNLGSTIYVKLPSFNLYGKALEDLATVPAYTVNLSPLTALPDQATGLALATAWTGSSLSVVCDPSARADTYRFRFYLSDETTLVHEVVSTTPAATYSAAQAEQDGASRTYAIEVVASNAGGDAAASSWLTVSNAAPPAVTTPAVAGGATTAVATCDASTDPDVAGYVLFYDDTSGFDPASSGGVVSSGVPSINIFGLAAGTYYGRIAATDGWSSNPSLLNLSAEETFAITSGGGSTPSGGGTRGGGFGGIKNRNVYEP